MPASQPFIGESGQVQTLAEYKVEMICRDDVINAAVQALIAAHPYEEPAYAIYKILTIEELNIKTAG